MLIISIIVIIIIEFLFIFHDVKSAQFLIK